MLSLATATACTSGSPPASTGGGADDPAAATSTPAASAAPSLDPTRPTGETVKARVVDVVDGDTVAVDIEGQTWKVRYIGVNTPETVAPGQPVEWMGPEASRENVGLVAERTVILEKDVSEVDAFGRLLRYVWVEGEDGLVLVNLELVARGYAQVATYPPDVKYVELFRAAQEEARSTGKGLWAPAATPQPSPTPAPTPTPTPTPIVAVIDDPIAITDESQKLSGEAGSYTWTNVAFFVDQALAKATASSASSSGCQVRWIVDPAGARIGSTIEVAGNGTNSKSRHFETPFTFTAIEVASTCAS